MPCGLSPDQCRRDHVATRLDDTEADGTDFEARCPECGHGGFRVSRPTRSRSLRHIWTCACKRCRCSPGSIRAALLRQDISAACLGTYDGNAPKDIHPEVAKKQNLAIRDILAVPHLRPADMRIILAEAIGYEIPGEVGAFVKFAMTQGVGRRQAYEAASRWCRPSDSHPKPRGGVVDTSRNTDEGNDVKPTSSAPSSHAETAQSECGNRAETLPLDRAETAQRKPAA